MSIFALGLSTISLAQNKNVKKGSQQWIQYYNQSKIGNKWTWSFDGGYRWNTLFSNPYQYIVRTGLGYQLSSTMKVSAGFAHLGFYTSDKLSKVEYRPYEELAITNSNKHFGMLQRFRIEERYFKNVVGGDIQSGHTFNFRFRYACMLNFKILKLSNGKPDEFLSMNLGDEIFINAGKKVVYNVFDQNRFLVGPSISFSKNFSIGLMYNSQFAALNTAKSYNYTDILWLTIKQNLDLTKHKKHSSNG
ncbi:MAG: DUF2490 domain-containing protein [Bacteroidota bacterium]|nr:DUF2490 domain-containing protein [Bacteroidota bacterium]